jgi:glycosyltransferase involved in cell wall biosynthesis
MSVYKNDIPEHFQEAVNSIINQTVQPTEIIIVADGYIPQAIDTLICKFKEENSVSFTVIRLKENQGLAIARQTGINHAKCDLIAVMDSDDIAVPDRFEKQLLHFQADEELSVLGGQISEFINTVDNIVGIRTVPLLDRNIKTYLKKRCPFNHMTVMMKKSDVIKSGNYLDWFWNEDYYLWIRMMLVGCKFKNLNDILVNVRVGNDMYRRRGGKKYFQSEIRLQKYMLDNHIIGMSAYCCNVFIRFVVQLLLPNKIRGIVFQRLLRNR